MSIKASSLRGATETVPVEFRGETFDVVVRLDYLTPAVEEEFAEAVEAKGGSAAMLELLDGLLVSWDVLDDDGEPIPTTVEGLRGIPSMVLVAVFTAVQQELASGGARKTSGDG